MRSSNTTTTTTSNSTSTSSCYMRAGYMSTSMRTTSTHTPSTPNTSTPSTSTRATSTRVCESELRSEDDRFAAKGFLGRCGILGFSRAEHVLCLHLLPVVVEQAAEEGVLGHLDWRGGAGCVCVCVCGGEEEMVEEGNMH